MTKITIDEFYEVFKQGFPDAMFTMTCVKGLNGKTQAFLLHNFDEKKSDSLETVVSTSVEVELRRR